MDAVEFNRLKYQGYFHSAGVSDVLPKDLSPCQNVGHNCTEFIYCLSGKEEVIVNGKSYMITAGMLRISPPMNISNEEISVRTIEKTRYIDIGYVAPDPFFEKTIVLDARKNRKIEDLAFKLVKINTGKYENWFFDASSVFWLFVKEIRVLINHTNHQIEYLDKKLLPAIRHIHENYTNCNFDFSALPEICGFRNNYFHKIFRQRYGITPAKYVTNLRMQLAADYLIYGNHSMSEIAELVGYDSIAYFSRVFKKYYGISPSKYNNFYWKAYNDYL